MTSKNILYVPLVTSALSPDRLSLSRFRSGDVFCLKRKISATMTATTTSHEGQHDEGDGIENDHQHKDDSENDDSGLEEMGFLFEGSRASTLKRLEWVVPHSPGNNNKNQRLVVRVALHIVDDEPGSVISGHYLWPAAPALAQHLINQYSSTQENHYDERPVGAILELGAGCALSSLVSLQLFTKSLKCVVVTDHDPGTLKRAQDNYDSTLEDLQSEESNENYPVDIASVPVLWEALSWGDAEASKELLSRVNREFLYKTIDNENDSNDNHATTACFDFVLGSDLIYCFEVIQPLFETAFELMIPGGRFLLSQSFPFDDESEHEIDSVCNRFGLSRKILSDSLTGSSQNEGVRIQEFVKKES